MSSFKIFLGGAAFLAAIILVFYVSSKFSMSPEQKQAKEDCDQIIKNSGSEVEREWTTKMCEARAAKFKR